MCLNTFLTRFGLVDTTLTHPGLPAIAQARHIFRHDTVLYIIGRNILTPYLTVPGTGPNGVVQQKLAGVQIKLKWQVLI
jgi:hypothetical protein